MTVTASLKSRTKPKTKPATMNLQRWGGLAAFVLAGSLIAANAIYLTGNLRHAFGAVSYDLADLLYGPVWAASFVTFVAALREQLAGRAPRRMTLALAIAIAAAAATLAVALIRSANRHYHIGHPDLHLESNLTVMVVWATLVAGISGVAFHLFGWASVLIGWAGRTSKRIPAALSALYLAVGIAAMFVYLQPELEGAVIIFSAVAFIWQGILLLRQPS
jgi:hypothetical protein